MCPEDMTKDNFLCIENKDKCNLVENEIQIKKDEDFQIIKNFS